MESNVVGDGSIAIPDNPIRPIHTRLTLDKSKIKADIKKKVELIMNKKDDEDGELPES